MQNQAICLGPYCGIRSHRINVLVGSCGKMQKKPMDCIVWNSSRASVSMHGTHVLSSDTVAHCSCPFGSWRHNLDEGWPRSLLVSRTYVPIQCEYRVGTAATALCILCNEATHFFVLRLVESLDQVGAFRRPACQWRLHVHIDRAPLAGPGLVGLFFWSEDCLLKSWVLGPTLHGRRGA